MKKVAVARLRAAAAASAAAVEAEASIDADAAEAFIAAFTAPPPPAPLLRFLDAEDGGDVLWTAPAAEAAGSSSVGVLRRESRERKRGRERRG